jgi:hypothetical protein
MPDAFWYAMFGAVPGTIGAIFGGYIAYTQRHLIRNTNSLVDKLVKTKEDQAYDQGKADQKANP